MKIGNSWLTQMAQGHQWIKTKFALNLTNAMPSILCGVIRLEHLSGRVPFGRSTRYCGKCKVNTIASAKHTVSFEPISQSNAKRLGACLTFLRTRTKGTWSELAKPCLRSPA